jgi:hypothetical protein
LDRTACQRVLFVRAEVVLRSDEARLVGVDDGAITRPDLDPYERVVQHRLVHDASDGCYCLRVGVQDAVGERIRDLFGAGHGRRAGVDDRLTLTHAT